MVTYIDENREQRCVHCDEFSYECECEPVYRIAYDIAHRKVGCVLIQAALGTVPSKLFNDHFGNADGWTVNADECQVYPIRASDLAKLAARTDFTKG